MYVYTIQDFGSSHFTECTSITVHGTVFQYITIQGHQNSRSRRHENKLALPRYSLACLLDYLNTHLPHCVFDVINPSLS